MYAKNQWTVLANTHKSLLLVILQHFSYFQVKEQTYRDKTKRANERKADKIKKGVQSGKLMKKVRK